MPQQTSAPRNTHLQTKANEVEYSPLRDKPEGDDNIPGSPGFGVLVEELDTPKADHLPHVNETEEGTQEEGYFPVETQKH